MADSPADPPDSISKEIMGLKQNDQEAIRTLWNRYCDQLKRLARRKMRERPCGVADSEDIAASVFASLCRGVKAGRFPDLDNREDLWRILIALTRHKTVDLIRAETSQKKGGGKQATFSIFGANTSSAAGTGFVDKEVGPAEMALLDDQWNYLLSKLPDETFRQIARLKLELCTVPEIAERTSMAPRSIERKLRLIRQIWAPELKEPIE